jgi:hypothetical protein
VKLITILITIGNRSLFRETVAMPGSHKFWFVWRAPLILLGLTLFGLLAALLGTGTWHWASWATLAAPIAVIIFYTLRRRPPART